MSRGSAWRRAQRSRIIALRLDRVRNWQQAGSFSGSHDNPLDRWYEPDPWPQAHVLGRFATWNPLVCCWLCQFDQFPRRPRWRWDQVIPEDGPVLGNRRHAASPRRWWADERS